MGLQLLIAALMFALPTPGQPTPLKLVDRSASALYSDGKRFVIVESPSELRIIDTATGRDRRMLDTDCSAGGVLFSQTHVAAGRAVLTCPSGQAVLRLATGRITPLPPSSVDGGFGAIGAWWTVAEAVGCAARPKAFCGEYVNHRTGERRVLPLLARGFRDLDDPALPVRRVCPPHRLAVITGQRIYEPPFLLDATVPRRCGDRRRLRTLPEAQPDFMNLSAGRVSWANPYDDSTGLAYVFDLRARRLAAWRVPRAGHGRPRGVAVHTRRHLFVGATVRANAEGDQTEIRVFRARLP
jgi:hypothetical protein